MAQKDEIGLNFESLGAIHFGGRLIIITPNSALKLGNK